MILPRNTSEGPSQATVVPIGIDAPWMKQADPHANLQDSEPPRDPVEGDDAKNDRKDQRQFGEAIVETGRHRTAGDRYFTVRRRKEIFHASLVNGQIDVQAGEVTRVRGGLRLLIPVCSSELAGKIAPAMSVRVVPATGYQQLKGPY